MNLRSTEAFLDIHESNCIILKNEEIIYKAFSLGIRPLLLFLEENLIKREDDRLVLVDKIIGKAAVLLAAKAKIDEIHTPLASLAAIETAGNLGIDLYTDTKVPRILNRTGDGLCPIETSVINTEDPETALRQIRETIKRLMA